MHVHCLVARRRIPAMHRNPKLEDVSGRGLQEWLGIRGETRRCATRGGSRKSQRPYRTQRWFLWIAPNDAGASLDEVVAHRDKVFEQQNLTALTDVLLANAGKVVTVVDSAQKEYTGEIVGFRQAEKSATEPASAAGDRVVPQPHVTPEFRC